MTESPSRLTMLLSRHTRRREFIVGLGSTAASWPVAAPAQQSATPVIGYLNEGSLETTRELVGAVHRGLFEA